MASSGPTDPQEPYSASSSRSNISRRRAESISSNVNDHNNSQPSGSTTLMPPDQNRPRSSSSSKALLTMALLEAQSAVQLDNAFDIPAALDAYRRAVTLLSKVMDASSSTDEQERLRTIHDSYLFRIHLLSTPPTTTPPSGPLPSLPQPPPPQQPLPQPPRQSTVASMTPANSSNTISSSHQQQQGYDSDSTTLPNSVVQGPSPRRVKKHIPVPLHPASVAPLTHPPTEPKTPRQRSDSTSASELGSPSHARHHTRSHTGGSIHRITGEMINGVEQLHLQQRIPGVPKVRSRDHLGVPIHSAPLGPLPPTPTALGPPPSTPPPVPTSAGSAPGSTPSTPSHSSPTTPNMPGHHTFLPTSPPPRSPLPQTPSNPVSPPASPAHATRRISPLVPSAFAAAGHLHQGAGHSSSPLQKSFLSPPESSPEDSNGITNGSSANGGAHNQFYEGEPVSDEWLPNLSSSKDYSYESGSEDPYPRERVSSKGSYSGSQLELIRTKVGQSQSTGAEQDSQKGDMPPYSSPQQSSPQHHQRSYSQSSTLSSHQVSASQASRSPLSGPMYSFQAGASSISSLHALEGTSHKRISDSSRSLKGSSGAANGHSAVGTSSPLSSSPGQSSSSRPTILQHQSSSSKLSSVVSNASTSPSLEKSWSPNMSLGGGGQPSLGGMTLFEVISDDPYAGMNFPLPPPSTEPAPSDPTLRCFWLMRRIEQSMLGGGFVTKRMYVPRAIWYQSLVRLPAAESKISACQTLMTILTKMSKINLLVNPGGGPEGDIERMTVLKELDNLETAAHQVQSKLSKKLSFIHRPGKNGGAPLTVATNQSYTEEMQGPVTSSGASIYGAPSIYGAASLYGNGSYDFLASDEPMPGQEKSSKKGSSSDTSAGGLKSQWKSFSKSVQKSMGNDKVEDTSAYTEAIVRLFQASYIIEAMVRHYSALSPFHTHLQIMNRLRRMCDVLNQVICAFVIRDMGELMGKYVKRVGAWVAD
ncbi:hypothetical protein BGX33_003479 [Mortierella sp. NVP41]|nr:hypothetical protein BGX33_003479 [Mortierella sp. NVP41]